MRLAQIVTQDSRLAEILREARTIAIVGLSPKPERDSFRVGRYLQLRGYRIIPVRPKQKRILGETAHATLDNLAPPVDIVDLFRRPEQILAHAQEALRLRPKVFWMQEGIEHRPAAELLTAAGIDVVMNRCIKSEHERLFGQIIL
jgi:hypothetical protein